MTKTVLSVLRSFDTASAVFMNIMHEKATKASSPGQTEDQLRATIIQYEQVLLDSYSNLRKMSEKNNDAYIDKSMLNFSITRDEVLKNKKVVDIFLDGNYLWVQLAPLKCYVEEVNTTYDIGSFLVRVNLLTCELRIFSTKYFIVPKNSETTSKVAILKSLEAGIYPDVGESIIPHPHVRAGNKPCLGNFSGMAGPVLANCQFNVLIELLIGYLEACNMNDTWGRIALAYPVIEGPGITEYSAKTYPKMLDHKYVYYCCYGGSYFSGNEEEKKAHTEKFRTDKQYIAVSFDTDLIIKTILQLPKDKRTLDELTYQPPVEAVLEEEVVYDYVPLSPQEAIELQEQGKNVQYIYSVDKDGFPVQTPVLYKDEPVAMNQAPTVTDQVFEQIAPAPKPKAPRKSRAKKAA